MRSVLKLEIEEAKVMIAAGIQAAGGSESSRNDLYC